MIAEGPAYLTEEIPERVVATLMENMSIWDLMNLRLLCKTTKSWVENPDVLKRLPVHVKDRHFLKKVIKSGVNWSNLSILCDTSDLTNAWIRSKDYLTTFSKLSTSLKILTLSEQRLPYHNGLEMILTNCSQLEELQVGTLDISKVAQSNSEDVLKSVENLMSLRITYIAWETEKDLAFLADLIKFCTNLTYLKIPYILTARLYSLYPSYEEDEIEQKLMSLTDQVLFTPIIQNLLKPKPSPTIGRTILKFLDVENFDLDCLLSKIVPACRLCGCLLLNVLESLEKPLSCETSLSLGETIGSLINCTPNLDLTTLRKLKSINITEDFIESTDIDKKCEVANLPALQNISLILTIKPLLASVRLASCFLHQTRESVRSVSVKFEVLNGSAQASVFKAPQFASSFPWLKKLSLDGFDGKSDHYKQFWKNFPLLEQLILQNCSTLNDESFVGSECNEAEFLTLTHLKELTLENCEDVSDKTIETTVTHLSLEVLTLALPKITFKGLSTLKTGNLNSSLMVFQCMKPDDCSEESFKKFLMSFKNVKKHEIIF